uniref:Uncharacterized protein n=1 Tax=Aegilops tauschii TaxID=37682 RepID=M8BGS6_AEGTA
MDPPRPDPAGSGRASCRRLIEEYNCCPMPAKILQILSTQPPSLQEDFGEWLTKKLPQILQEALVGIHMLDEPLTKTYLYSEFLLAKMDHQLQNMLAKLSQVQQKVVQVKMQRNMLNKGRELLLHYSPIAVSGPVTRDCCLEPTKEVTV